MIAARRSSLPEVSALLGLLAVLVVLAFARPLDHDESQYVAAAQLARHGVIYRDFAYLQTPLQPLLFAFLSGAWAFPGTRLLNAVLGTASVALVYGASRAGGTERRAAFVAAGLFACCDIFLFSATVARNDMLPACLFSAALCLMVRQVRGEGSRATALAIGLLLSAATAAKLSYAVPALAYGGLALIDRRHRPIWLVIGALPPAGLVAMTWLAAPDAFAFDVLRFPTAAPEQFYAAGRAWKLALWARALDLLKFLALGPGLLAAGLVLKDRRRERLAVMLEVMIVAGLIAAILPAPTWRQYLLVMLPPLFVRLSLFATIVRPPRGLAAAATLFVVAGIAPSLLALIAASRSGLPLLAAIDDGRALRTAMDRYHVAGPVATLSPQFVPATGRPIDPRFAAGPFFFRSTGLLSAADERRFALVGRATAAAQFEARPPAAIVTGGEGPWTSGDAALDGALAEIAQAQGWRAVAVPGTPFTLHVRGR
ncbi:MAG: ArnT family glycosyltransferase [Sphingomonas sp.]